MVACQQACPTSAIEFGDLNEKGSRVAQSHGLVDRAAQVHLGTVRVVLQRSSASQVVQNVGVVGLSHVHELQELFPDIEVRLVERDRVPAGVGGARGRPGPRRAHDHPGA